MDDKRIRAWTVDTLIGMRLSVEHNHADLLQAARELVAESEAALDRQGAWISVEERLPETSAPVLIEWIMDDSSGTEVASFNGMGWYHGYNFAPFFKAHVTHWQPLPPAPEKP